jgi:hypothetical protein
MPKRDTGGTTLRKVELRRFLITSGRREQSRNRGCVESISITERLTERS